VNLRNLRRQSNRQQIILDIENRVGSGGEGHIYPLQTDSAIAAKIYHTPTLEREHKLAAMLDNPPDDPARARGYTSITWPTDLLLDDKGGVVGFLMTRVPEARSVIDYYGPAKRRQYCPGFDYFYLHRAASNLASTVGALHERGYIIGDVNESNVLLNVEAMITIVDTDSFQVYDPQNNTLYRCPVGKSEFTPPELQNIDFKDVDRATEHDLFGLAVLIFRLLMEGTHPFDGKYVGAGDPPQIQERIAAGHFPHGSRFVPYTPKPGAPSYDLLHPELQRLFGLCFVEGHTHPAQRPTAKQWLAALATAAEALQICRANDQHRYSAHLSACPWCERSQRLGRDPFPSKQSIMLGTYRQLAPPAPTPQAVEPLVPPPQVVAPPVATPSVTAPLAPNSQVAALASTLWSQPVTLPLPAPIPAVAPPLQPVAPVGNRLSRRNAIRLAIAATSVAVIGFGGYATYSNATRTPTKRPWVSNNLNMNDGANLVLIPGGEFIMGSKDNNKKSPHKSPAGEHDNDDNIDDKLLQKASADKNDNDDEKPTHKVSLDSYYIYKMPVTVKQYLAFCAATGYAQPEKPPWGWQDDHPIVNVSWNDANAYAHWAGAQLPTEAQWEKAARGANGQTYPWGSDWDTHKLQCSKAKSGDAGATAAVGSFVEGASPYGVLDMAGNVWQWCADWYRENYYQVSPNRNPSGPESSPDGHVMRGGSWSDNSPKYFRCAFRFRDLPDHKSTLLGFRCVVRADIH
jgi:formylglycine-generating enzyme required for sulfatase activity